MRIGKRLKAIRIARGLSQARLSKLSNVSQSYISELEADEKNPTIPIIEKIAAALGISVAELLSGFQTRAVGR